MTKSTITRERLEKIKSWRETYGAGSNVMLPAEEAEALARMALAAMDNSESVVIDKVKLGEWLDNEVGGVRPEQYEYYINSFYEKVIGIAMSSPAIRKFPEPDYDNTETRTCTGCENEGGAGWRNAEGDFYCGSCYIDRMNDEIPVLPNPPTTGLLKTAYCSSTQSGKENLVRRLDVLLNEHEAKDDRTEDEIFKQVSSFLEKALAIIHRPKNSREMHLEAMFRNLKFNLGLPDSADMVDCEREIYRLREVDEAHRHAQPAPTCESITVTDDMAYAFHHALTDSMIGADDVEEIKTGLRAVFANLTAPVVSAEYPDRLPCSVLLEPGLRFGKGIKTSTMLAALARRAVHESDMAALSPEERVEFQARIEEFKALIAQPAPAVPEEITIETATIIAYGLPTTNIGAIFKAGHDACRAARLKAQPQNAPQNIPEIIPGWIPVSEKMPPSRHEVLVGRWWGEKPRWCCKWATYIPGHPDSQSSGWLIPGGSWTPTHWMELPAAPQGVKP